jgi:hypothetical protein
MQFFKKRCRSISEYLRDNHRGTFYLVTAQESKRLIYVSRYQFVVRCLMDQLLGNVKIWHYDRKHFPTAFDFVSEPWTWQRTGPEEFKLQTNLVTQGELLEYQLLNTKSYALEILLVDVQKLHVRLTRGELTFQNMIYLEKAKQAQAVVDGEQSPEKIYHVQHWAQLRGIQLITAAREILFKAEEANIYLAQIEQLRLNYTHAILSAKTEEELPEILSRFDHECFSYAQV